MNFEKYAKALAEHTDKTIEELLQIQAGVRKPESRPFDRARQAEPMPDYNETRKSHRSQSNLFPGSDPMLARWED